MTTSERIRELGQKGIAVTEIADQLGIRYQHAYNVLKTAGYTTSRQTRITRPANKNRYDICAKPSLTLTNLGISFTFAGQWRMSDEYNFHCDRALPVAPGVYAFVQNQTVLYVGVASKNLAQRLYFYAKPGPRQLTNLRLNKTIRQELLDGKLIEIHTSTPPDLEWNGLPINGAAGLELGLIRQYSLPWNIRSN